MKKKFFAMAIALMSAVASFGQITAQDWTDPSGNAWKLFAFSNAQLLARVQVDNYLGKYYNVQILLNNESGDPITLDPSLMKASIVKKGKSTDLKVYDHDGYVKAIKAKNGAANFGAALLSGGNSAPAEVNTASIDKFYIDNKEVADKEQYLGMVNIEHKPGDTLIVTLLILGNEYTFEFDVKGLK